MRSVSHWREDNYKYGSCLLCRLRNRDTSSGLEHTVDAIDAVAAANAVNAVSIAVAVGHDYRALRSRLRQKDRVAFAFTKLNIA
jgi:hypothetical protein